MKYPHCQQFHCHLESLPLKYDINNLKSASIHVHVMLIAMKVVTGATIQFVTNVPMSTKMTISKIVKGRDTHKGRTIRHKDFYSI